VIKRRTQECCTILTTHSMEECEALCARIGVMVDGTLRCLGPIQTLKARYGQGWHVAMRLEPTADPDQILKYLQQAFSGVTLDEFEPPLMEINVPQSVALSALFAKLEQSREQLKVKECSVTQTTLEQVFVKMAKKKDDAAMAQQGIPAPPPVELQVVRKVVIKRAKGQKIGLDLVDHDGQVLVEKVHAGYAAALCGALIYEKDVVSAVGTQPTSSFSRDDIYKLIGGIKGSEIELTLDSSSWYQKAPATSEAQPLPAAAFEIEAPEGSSSTSTTKPTQVSAAV